MSFKYVQSKAAQDVAAGTTASLTLDAAPREGSLLVAAISTSAGQADISAAGWTGGTIAGNGRMLWKIAGASESASPSFTLATSADWSLHVAEYRSTDDTPFVAESIRGNLSGTNTNADVTPTAGLKCLVVAYAAYGIDTSFSALTIGGGTGTNVGAVTQREYVHRTAAPINGSSVLFDAEISSANGSYHSSVTPAAGANNLAALMIFELSKSFPVSDRRKARNANLRR